MSTINDEWPRVRSLLERAMELEGELRARFLDDVCAGDTALRGELEQLLARDAHGEALEPPRIAPFARRLESEAKPRGEL